MENHPYHEKSIIIGSFGRLIEFGNKWLTLSGWILPPGGNIFYRLEIMMIIITFICIGILMSVHLLPSWLAITVSVILIQRVIEFLVVYSRNFILNRGRIFAEFPEPEIKGQWLILMFIINVFQISIVFAIWYRLISFMDADAFTQSMGILDSLYFSMITFLTTGFGDIVPVSALSKILVMIQGFLTFYILVIVINGLISIQFKR